MSAAGGLRELHVNHLRLEEVREDLARGPRQIKNAEKRVARREEEIEEQRERLMQLKMSADQKSLQMKTNEANIDQLKVKLNAASTNKEFDAFKSQIEADEMANSVLEDEVLEVFEKIDEVEAQIADLEQQRDASKEEVKTVAARVEAESPGLRAKADELEAKLSEGEKQLPEQVAVQYRRLVAAHGADALSSVEKSTCQSCLVQVRRNTQVELNMGKYVFCSSCNRLLYQMPKE